MQGSKKLPQPSGEGIESCIKTHKTLVVGVAVAVLIVVALWLLTQPETNKSIIPS